MENNYTVYKHTFPNGKIYVGITCQKPQNRWGKDGSGYKNQTLIYRAIQKYGWDNIKHTILCEKLSEEAACKKEQEFISIFNSANPKYGYNNTYGGEHCKHTLISRSKLSKAKLGKPSNRKNCTLSEESKLKISKSKKGKLVGADNPMYGKHHTEDALNKMRKKVVCVETGQVFKSVTEAAKICNSCPANIVSCLKKRRNTACGYHWEYYEEGD